MDDDFFGIFQDLRKAYIHYEETFIETQILESAIYKYRIYIMFQKLCNVQGVSGKSI